MNSEELINFEKKIESLYEEGKIKAPIHLRGNNEDTLIEIFKKVNEEDYVISTWGSHLHALLKGVPEDEMEQAILDGRSITLCFPVTIHI